MRVLMFGWEFPPVVSGGLGVATEGLVRGLLENRAEVVLVLPHPPEEIRGGALTIRSALSPASGARSPRPGDGGDRGDGSVSIRRIRTLLRPYVTAEKYEEYERHYGDVRSRASRGRGSGLRPKRPQRSRRAQEAARSPDPYRPEPYGHDLRDEVLRYAGAAAAIARKERFDVIHAHDWLTFLAGVAARRESGRPLAVHVHATELDRAGENGDPFVVRVERLGLEQADRVIAVSSYTADLLRRRYDVPEERIRVVHNAIDGPPATPAPSVPAPFPAADPVVLFAGRLTWQKGPEHFVDAAALVAQELPRAKFVVAGSGDRLAATIERAATLGIADRFEFTGFLDRPALDRLYEEADVYVMPSVSEPFGLTALEALRHGTPVILSRHAGVSEVVPNVLRVDFDDPRELASKILSVLLFRPLSGVLSQRGRDDVERLSWKESAATCLEVYREMVERSRAADTIERS